MLIVLSWPALFNEGIHDGYFMLFVGLMAGVMVLSVGFVGLVTIIRKVRKAK
jgi:hypothetical protein